MASIYWTNGAGGDFGTATNWSTDAVPGASDQARIDDGSGATVSADETVLSLATNAAGSLDINGDKSFTMLEGTGIGANAGTIWLFDSAELVAGGTIDNTGYIVLASTSDATQLLTAPGQYLTLSGDGQVEMTGDAIVDITTNVSNTISGAGTVSLSNNEKKGVINADTGESPFLTVNASNQTLINAGTLEATNSGLLYLNGTINDSSGGLIDAVGASAGVALYDVTLIGGTLETSGGGTIGYFTCTLEGTINNIGSITASTEIENTIAINAAGATLEGGGAITLNSSLTSSAASAKLTNVNNTISGIGLIGNSGSNTLTLINQSKGVIDGNGGYVFDTPGEEIQPLIIDTGTNAITNAGTLEATTGTVIGELYIASPVTNSGGNLVANDGVIVAAGVVTGGRDTIKGTGTVEFGAASSALTTFATGSTGGLILDDAAQYTGIVSGFGKNITQSIDLPNVLFATASKTYSGGTLTVKDTSGDVAHIKFSGSYTLASFTLSNDGHGGTLITDPPIAKATHATGVDIGLLGSYIASSLLGASLGQGGSLSTDASALLSPPLLATPGHA